MADFNFKVGDKVYYPAVTNKILQVDSALRISYIGTDEFVTCSGLNSDGKFHSYHQNPSYFPATLEWYEKLVHAYPNLEKPPVKKSSKEVIQAMLDDGWLGVPCWVRDNDLNLSRGSPIEVILEIREVIDYIFKTYAVSWRYATPYDPKTGKEIVDYVDGKVVLANQEESENE